MEQSEPMPIDIDDFEGRPDLSKSVVQVLGTADVQHDLAKIAKIISQHNRFLENQAHKEKKSRTFPLKKRQVLFWERVKGLFVEEFAAEVAAYDDPYRLEQCAKKKQARLRKKEKSTDTSPTGSGKPSRKRARKSPKASVEEVESGTLSGFGDELVARMSKVAGGK